MFAESYDEMKKMFGDFEDELSPMIGSINYALGDNFVNILRDMLNEIGHGGNNIGFFFPSGFDPWDEEYFEDGVMFQWGILGVIADNQTFYKYIKKAVEAFILRYPDEKTEAKEMLLKIKTKYNCTDEPSADRILGNVLNL